MHELSVCRALLDQVAAIAKQHGAQRVQSIHLCIGPLAGVEPDLLQTSFPFASAGSIAEGASLKIEKTPLRVHCDRCSAETVAIPARLTCAACGNGRTRLVSGDELLLASVELSG